MRILKAVLRDYIRKHSPRPTELLNAMCPPPEFSKTQVLDLLTEMLESHEIELTADRHIELRLDKQT